MGLKNRGGANGEKIATLDFIYRQYVISPHRLKFLLQSDGDRQTQLFLRNFFSCLKKLVVLQRKITALEFYLNNLLV